MSPKTKFRDGKIIKNTPSLLIKLNTLSLRLSVFLQRSRMSMVFASPPERSYIHGNNPDGCKIEGGVCYGIDDRLCARFGGPKIAQRGSNWPKCCARGAWRDGAYRDPYGLYDYVPAYGRPLCCIRNSTLPYMFGALAGHITPTRRAPFNHTFPELSILV